MDFPSPAELILWNYGSGRDEEPSGRNVLRLIQIRLAASSLQENRRSCQANSGRKRTSQIPFRQTQSVFDLFTQQANANRSFYFQEGSELIIGVHNKPLPHPRDARPRSRLSAFR